MWFTKDEIERAKQGTHRIQWQPSSPGLPQEEVSDLVRVVRVRGDRVWVQVLKPRYPEWAKPVALNRTASENLIAGKNRVRSVKDMSDAQAKSLLESIVLSIREGKDERKDELCCEIEDMLARAGLDLSRVPRQIGPPDLRRAG